jgi:hypothetical protein
LAQGLLLAAAEPTGPNLRLPLETAPKTLFGFIRTY